MIIERADRKEGIFRLFLQLYFLPTTFGKYLDTIKTCTRGLVNSCVAIRQFFIVSIEHFYILWQSILPPSIGVRISR